MKNSLVFRMSFWQIFFGIALMAIGLHIVWKTDGWFRFFGRVPFAEIHFGFEGGSRMFYKLIGILTIFIGMFTATGLVQGIVVGIFGRLFGSL
jgi:hypothetical protein